jgi:hypothetical protein
MKKRKLLDKLTKQIAQVKAIIEDFQAGLKALARKKRKRQ